MAHPEGHAAAIRSCHRCFVAQSPYAVLGLSRGASTDDVKQAYRARVKRCHPDHGGSDDEFRQLQAAYELLLDPAARARYDAATGDAPSSPRVRGEDVVDVLRVPFAVAVTGGAATYRQLSVSVPPGVCDGDLLRLAGLGRHGVPRGDLVLSVLVDPHPHYRAQGLDLYLTLPVTWLEAYAGASIPLATPWRSVQLDVAPGTRDGLQIIVEGDGIRRDGARGDLIVTLELVAPPIGDDTLAGVLFRLQRLQPVRGRLGELFE